MEQQNFSQEEWETCIKVLTTLKDNPFNNPDNQTFKSLITSIHKQAKRIVKQSTANVKKAEDYNTKASSGIIEQAKQQNASNSHTDWKTLHFAQHCYACNNAYHQMHFFYYRLCPSCATEHFTNRSLDCDLSNHNVVLTGGRVKVGYATALKILRSGANLLLTTRFPAIAYNTLRTEPDFDKWQDRLTIYGLDLRNLKAIKHFIQFCEQHFESLEILINNAAQTIQYPLDYYKPLIAQEQLHLKQKLPNLIGNTTPITNTVLSLPDISTFESLPLNRFGQPIDYREKNSWNATLDDIELEELLEVNLINHIAPYQLIAGLKPMLLKSKQSNKFIINVTSSEGQFSYKNKNIFHPHTNMTKAALNMLTRTSGAEFVADNIYMNAVDVGWISTGAYEAKRKKLFDELRIPPLDITDGAARILHPITTINKGIENWHGVLLKDYKVADW